MTNQFARARQKGGEHRRGESLSWRGEEAIGQGNTGNVEVEATARGRTCREANKTKPANNRKIDDPPPWPRQSSSEEEMQQKITRIPISTPKMTIGVGRAAGASGGVAERPRNLRNDSKSNLEASDVCAEASGGYVDLSRPSKDKADRYFCGRGYDDADSTSLQRQCGQPVVLL